MPPNPIINSNSIKSFIPSLLYINVNQFQHHPKSSSTFVLQCSLSEGAAGNSQPPESGIQQRNGVMEGDGRSASCPEEERNKNGFRDFREEEEVAQ